MRSILSIVIWNSFRDGPCQSYIDTCCLVPEKRPETDPIIPKPDPVKPERQGCGWRNPEGVAVRTTGDTDGETKFGEFPWMVAILKIEPVNENEPDGQKLNVYVGGGSLIHPSVVLTAAHYVASGPQLRVRAGEWDTQHAKEPYPYQDRDVSRIVVHKDFNKGNLFYDVALLFLNSPMDLAPNVGLACLPKARERATAGTRCFASGWGKDKFGKDGRYQVILKKIEVPVVDRNTCRDQLRKTRLGRYFELHSSFMCAGGEPGRDTCKGDGGSPLMYKTLPLYALLACACAQTEDLESSTRQISEVPFTSPTTQASIDNETPSTRQGCGWRNPEGVVVRTTGDTDGETKFGEFPWMVAILKIKPANENEPDSQYVGGGSLIHPSVVLTAAHYVASGPQLRVRAGEWDTQHAKEPYPHQDRDVSRIVVHKDFNKGDVRTRISTAGYPTELLRFDPLGINEM
ncbi:hypothetical protein O3G_MSEX011240 [Manduca sexta]|uniref:Peptidase S1 domain-containing protein n=1 Tax=Manduca sexta TaxID=7130 RepID=A0A921ZKE4_MANSE|nr:hypothetical protein O3G_MSEX011240 [Manduca sexta]